MGTLLYVTAGGHCLPVLPAGDVKPQNVLLDGDDWNVLVRAGGSASPTCAALRGKPSPLRALPANQPPTRRCLRPPPAPSSPVRPSAVFVCVARCPSVRTAAVDRLRHRAVAVVGPHADEPDRDGAVHAARSPERCVCVRALLCCVMYCVFGCSCCWVRRRWSSSSSRQIQTTPRRGQRKCARQNSLRLSMCRAGL